MVLVPGGSGSSDAFTRPPSQAQTLADAGFAIVVFDPDGRGQSAGREDYDGFTQQDGLAAVIRFAATLPEVDAKQIGPQSPPRMLPESMDRQRESLVTQYAQELLSR